ncbi:hypothetical protein BN1080_02095 [Planococcus massiliensis]|uniref:Uncharacterized protein n=1 Tax=Planococcus massiliensis TaxID=1499687 RepID=A0A098EPC5_9BACL|nr:hypothetical protein [Planococcus massiliensis]CEG23151.1 hypothetical protein BN1080_02095 [Planococcus massiliensis]
MDKEELRLKRQAILREIDRLEYKRCEKCMGNTTTNEQRNCNCHAAKKIRKFGEEYSSLTMTSKQDRLNRIVEEFHRKGLTPELYRRFREAEISNKEIRKLIGWDERKLNEWRNENGFALRVKKPSQSPIQVKAIDAEENGLTLAIYKNSKKIGFTDKEIREKYRLSQTALVKFKTKYNLMLPPGKHAKRLPRQISGGVK